MVDLPWLIVLCFKPSFGICYFRPEEAFHDLSTSGTTDTTKTISRQPWQ
jgi:hypothetical protein